MTPMDDSMIDALLRRGDETAPAELRNAVTSLVRGDPIPDGEHAVPPRRRLVALVSAAAVLVLLVAGLVIATRDRQDTITTSDVPISDVPTSLVPTSSLLDGDRRDTATTEVAAPPAPDGASSDAFDRGRNKTLRLDPDTEERLHGVVVASLDVEADAVAVAEDGAVGVLEGTTLRIEADGEQIAARDVDLPDNDSRGGRDSIAFDTDGTLWVWTGRGVAGLRRDGTSVDVDGIVPSTSSPGSGGWLRVNGTNVSVVLNDRDRPSWAEVIPVVGDDPLEGVRTVDTPVTVAGQVSHTGRPYTDGSGRAVLTSELFLSGSIVGSNRAELDWTELPNEDGGFSGTDSASPIVADTAASLLSMSIYDGSFLIVHRSDGTSAVGIVAAGEGGQVTVSPDGAVHVATIADGTTTVRTVLDADLQPLQAPTVDVVADTPTASATPDLPECGAPSPRDQIVDDVDLDADGNVDRVTLDEDGLILACLTDGTRSAMAAWAVADLQSATQTLSRVDLGGVDGVMVTLEPGPEVAFHVQNYLLHLHDGALSAVGSASLHVGGIEDNVYGVDHVAEGWDFPTGPNFLGTPGSFGVMGCRPAVLPDTDFDAIVLTHTSGTNELHAEASSVAGDEVHSLDSLAPDLVGDLPRVATRDELDSILRDAGFSPGCRPIGPDDEPVAPTPTLAPTPPSAACDDEREWDIQVDLDTDGQPDRVTLAPRAVKFWGLLVACMADGSVASIAVGPGPAQASSEFVALKPLDLAGTPGIALVSTLGRGHDTGEYDVFVLADGELVALTPNETSGSVVEGVLEHLPLWGTTSVETFGCRPRPDGGVDFVELLIERVDDDVTNEPTSPAFTGERLAVSYVVRTSSANWTGISEPSERVELPAYDGGTARPAEILEDLGANWLCQP